MKTFIVTITFLLVTTIAMADDKFIDHPTIKQMHKANDALRVNSRCAGLLLTESLTKAAQDHAWYMARMHDKGDEEFEHRGGNGSPGKRAARHSYEGVVVENIARGYRSVDDVFKAWEKSADHKDAIYSDTTEVGFGYAVAKDGTTYWVSLYGKPKPWTPQLPNSQDSQFRFTHAVPQK